jgi:hypothetical protein
MDSAGLRIIRAYLKEIAAAWQAAEAKKERIAEDGENVDYSPGDGVSGAELRE